MNQVEFYHISLNNIDTKECLELCNSYFNSKETSTIFFINAHCFNISLTDNEYKNALLKSNLVLNDGIGIKIAARLKHIRLKENMNGTDLIPKVIEYAVYRNKGINLLGAKPDIITTAADNLKKKHPKINLTGYSSGYYDRSDELNLIEEINNSGAELLIVGMGVPLQEKWILKNKNKLNNIKLIIAGGAIFDFIALKFKRAPKPIQVIGLEWVWRLVQEPRRLLKRYIVGNPRFLLYIIKYNFLRK